MPPVPPQTALIKLRYTRQCVILPTFVVACMSIPLPQFQTYSWGRASQKSNNIFHGKNFPFSNRDLGAFDFSLGYSGQDLSFYKTYVFIYLFSISLIVQEENHTPFSHNSMNFTEKGPFPAKHIFDQPEHIDLIGLNIKELQNPTAICGHRSAKCQRGRFVLK